MVSVFLHYYIRHIADKPRDALCKCNGVANLANNTPSPYVDVDVDVEEIRAQTNNCLYARY